MFKNVCVQKVSVCQNVCASNNKNKKNTKGIFSSNSLAALDHQRTAAGDRKMDFFSGNSERILGSFRG